MSYGIMGSGRNSHILTYQTTKQIGCLYFDGESATLFGSGMMDAQMLFILGVVRTAYTHDTPPLFPFPGFVPNRRLLRIHSRTYAGARGR